MKHWCACLIAALLMAFISVPFPVLLCSFDGNNGVSSSSQAVGQNSASAFSSSESTPSGSTGTTETSSDGK